MDAQPRQRRGVPGDLVTREQRRIYEDAMAVIEEATEESAESIRRRFGIDGRPTRSVPPPPAGC
jgi:hypothetical protein